MKEVSLWFQLGINVLDYFIMLYYFSLLSERQKERKILFWITGGLYIATITYANLEIRSTWVNLLVSVMAVVGISMFYEKREELGKLLFYDIVYIAMCILAESFALCIVKLLLNSSDLNIRQNYVCNVVIGKIFLILFCYCFIKNKTKQQGGLERETGLMLCLSTVISTWIVVALADKITTYAGWKVTLYMGAELGCICLNLILHFLMEHFQKMYQQILENKQIQHEMEQREEHLKALEEKEKEIRGIRHDLRNQLLELNVKLDRENTIEKGGGRHEQAKAFVNTLIETLEENRQYTDNPIVNAILKEKINTAKEKGIPVTYEIDISASIQLESGDMGIILGNLMDNAIEAGEKTEAPYIVIQIRQINKSLYIAIQNRMEGKMQGELFTTKKDKKNHGFGLASVRKTVEKYSGHMQIDRKDGIFVVEIMLVML